MITCQHIYEHASDYMEGPVTLRERLQLLVHLVICKYCRRYLRQLRTVIGIAAAVAPADIPTDEQIDVLVSVLLQSGTHP